MNEFFIESLKKKTVAELFEIGTSKRIGSLRLDNESIDLILNELNSRNLNEQETEGLKNLKYLNVKSSTTTTTGKYPVLKALTGIIEFIGYLLLVIGVISIFIFYHETDNLVLGLLSFIGSIIIAVPFIAFSNLIRVFLDTEYNTRKAMEALNDLLKK